MGILQSSGYKKQKNQYNKIGRWAFLEKKNWREGWGWDCGSDEVLCSVVLTIPKDVWTQL